MMSLRFEDIDDMMMDQYWSNEQPNAADATQSSRGASQYPLDHRMQPLRNGLPGGGGKRGLLDSLKELASSGWPSQLASSVYVDHPPIQIIPRLN